MYRVQKKYISQPLGQITRNLIKSTLNSQKFQDKFINAKSAVLSAKLRGCLLNQYHSYYPLDTISQKIYQNLGVEKAQACIGTQIPFNEQVYETKIEGLSEFSYFKQTLSTYVQTQNQFYQIFKKCQLNKDLDLEQIQSKISLETNDTYQQQEGFDSVSNFSINLQTKSSFIKKKSAYDSTTEEVDSLKTEIQALKSQITVIDQQKNKWKKKALKNSSKIKAIQMEHQRFQNEYQKTMIKQ